MMQCNLNFFFLCLVTLEGTCDGRVFDERELKFEVGDGDNLDLPAGVEKSIMAMEQGEEALFTIKPKYDQSSHWKFISFSCGSSLFACICTVFLDEIQTNHR